MTPSKAREALEGLKRLLDYEEAADAFEMLSEVVGRAERGEPFADRLALDSAYAHAKELRSALAKAEAEAECHSKNHDAALDLLDEARSALAEAEQERDELEALFDLQHKRMVKATKLWREAHPGNDLTSPDLGAMLDWLLVEKCAAEIGDAALVENESLRSALAEAQQINRDWIRDWENIAEAAGEEPDIMPTSLRGRIVNMRAALAEAERERDWLREGAAREVAGYPALDPEVLGAIEAVDQGDGPDYGCPHMLVAVGCEDGDYIAESLSPAWARSLARAFNAYNPLRARVASLEEENRGLREAVVNAANAAHMDGRVYVLCGEKETPAEVCDAMQQRADYEIRRALSGGPAETEPEANYPQETGPMDGVWRCQDCGEMVDPVNGDWRWAFDRWEHHHAYPAGHVAASYFGPAETEGGR